MEKSVSNMMFINSFTNKIKPDIVLIRVLIIVLNILIQILCQTIKSVL
nr:MAG TPA: hypothetical protein [Crassvirales sp.]